MIHKMMKVKFNLLITLLFFSVILLAQKPNNFQLETNPNNSNFEIYSQKGGVQRRTTMDFARNYFAPKINTTILTTAPAPAGNTQNINSFVYFNNGANKAFIDHFGVRFDFPNGNATNFANADLIATGNRTHDFGLNNLVITKKLSTTSSAESAIALTDGAYMYSQDTAGIKTGWLNLKNGDAKLTAVDYSDFTQRCFNVGQDAFYLKDKTDNTNKYLKILDNTGKIEFVDAPTAKLRAGEGISIKNDTIINLGADAKTSTPNLNSKRYIHYNIQDSASAGLHFIKSNATEFEVGYPIIFEGTDNDAEDRNTEILFKMKSSSGDSVTHKIAANSAALFFHSGKGLVFSGTDYMNMSSAGVNMSNTSTGFGLVSDNLTNSTSVRRMRIGNINTLNTTSILFGDNNIEMINVPSVTSAATVYVKSPANGSISEMPIASIAPTTTHNFASSANTMTSTVNNVAIDAPIINSNALSIINGQLISTINNIQSAALALPATSVSVGDTKHGYRASDHNGWILLNGRTIATLTTTQQTAATTLGFVGTLPNTQGRVPIAANGNVGAFGGSATGQTTLVLGNIPLIPLPNANVNIEAYTTIGGGTAIAQGGNSISGTSISNSVPVNYTTSVIGNAFPTSINVPVNPLSVSLNHFIYLGN